jgi:hypothetical protein
MNAGTNAPHGELKGDRNPIGTLRAHGSINVVMWDEYHVSRVIELRVERLGTILSIERGKKWIIKNERF